MNIVQLDNDHSTYVGELYTEFLLTSLYVAYETYRPDQTICLFNPISDYFTKIWKK